MIFLRIEVFIVKYITKSASSSNFDALCKSIKGDSILRLDAPNLFDLELLADMIYSRSDVEMIGDLNICWSWRYLIRVWSVDIGRVREKNIEEEVSN
ncbi:MAG: hypothetical protein L3J08_08390 [Flavobacteriaceae bacterium]|nr:hypothetical protein [Flavobacteriaceae bacterium]